MAQKRMFSLSVVDTDQFLEMPISSRLLYYELGMRADDDGFVDNWKKILMFTGLKDDDMKLLIAKQFIIPFESGVIVIRHWRLNNYLQNDRIKPTIHQEELKQLDIDNGEYNLITDKFIEEHENYLELDFKSEREKAYKESELPYSFDYKIRKAFRDEKCPICGYEMKDYVNSPHRPTIQHNIPISKGGRHELGNISVICHKCNVSLQDKITDELNAQEVIEKWDNIDKCIQGCIHSIDKNSIDKNSIDKNSINTNNKEEINKEERNDLFTFIENNFGRTLNPIEYEEVSKLEDNELTRYAIKQSILNGAYTIKYINGILQNYKNKNITSVQQAQQEELEFKKRKDKQQKEKGLTAREKRDLEFEELLKKYESEDNL